MAHCSLLIDQGPKGRDQGRGALGPGQGPGPHRGLDRPSALINEPMSLERLKQSLGNDFQDSAHKKTKAWRVLSRPWGMCLVFCMLFQFSPVYIISVYVVMF